MSALDPHMRGDAALLPPDVSAPSAAERERLQWALVMSTRSTGWIGYDEATDELRNATWDYTLALKSRGLTVEQVLANVVELLRSTRVRLTARPSREARDEWPALARRVADWSAVGH
jgi:hypothetical protein